LQDILQGTVGELQGLLNFKHETPVSNIFTHSSENAFTLSNNYLVHFVIVIKETIQFYKFLVLMHNFFVRSTKAIGSLGSAD